MRKDKMIRSIIRHRNRELRARLFGLSPFWWSIIIFLIAISLLIISFIIFDTCNWASGALVSTSCGCFTGLVFYFLSNVRNNKLSKLQKEYRQLQMVLDVLKNITNTAVCYKLKVLLGSRRDVYEDRENVYLWLDELEAARNQLPYTLYDILPEKGYDPSDRDNLNRYRDQLLHSDQEQLVKAAILGINDELLPLVDHLQELYREREDQLMLMGKHFF